MQWEMKVLLPAPVTPITAIIRSFGLSCKGSGDRWRLSRFNDFKSSIFIKADESKRLFLSKR